VGKPEGKRQIGRQSADGKIILKIVLREEGVKSFHLAEYRGNWWVVVNLVMKRHIP